jgi:membrane complex biogenesis BtpA family protein
MLSKIGIDHKWIVGVVHVRPLPGTPFYKDDLDDIITFCVKSAKALFEGGANGCLVQTVDKIYSVKDTTDPLRLISLNKITQAIRNETASGFEIGVQIMRNANKASLATAKACQGQFVRIETFVGNSLSPQGMVHANPLELIEYRTKINAKDIKIIADIKTRHYEWFSGNKSVAEVANYAKNCGADAIAIEDRSVKNIISMIDEIRNRNVNLPVILAGYTNFQNVKELLSVANGAYVGSCVEDKETGAISSDLVKRYMEIVNNL